MSSFSREAVILILQYLDEEKYKETAHKLEQESGFYFNMTFFEDMVIKGEWDVVDKYLSGFTKAHENRSRYTTKIFHELWKLKYLEALGNLHPAKALEVLEKDLKIFAAGDEDLSNEIKKLATLANSRNDEQLSDHGDPVSVRHILLADLKQMIESNPLFRDKLQFPALKCESLRTLINQSLSRKHQVCDNPRSNPGIRTPFVDHGQPYRAWAPSNSSTGVVPKQLVGPMGLTSRNDAAAARRYRTNIRRYIRYMRAYESTRRANEASPRIKFLQLAVSTNDYGIKLLAHSNGVGLFSFDGSRAPSADIIMKAPRGGYFSTHIANVSSGIWDRTAPVVPIVGMRTKVFLPPPLAATFLAFHPRDDNGVAAGMEDSSIRVFDIRSKEVKTKLKGHQRRISGLAFSDHLNVLVSAGADSQLCVWSTDGWKKQTNTFLEIPGGISRAPVADTRIQFHLDQVHLLAVQERQIAIYEAPQLECPQQGCLRESSVPITHATYSCKSQYICVSFEDGSVSVMTATDLTMRFRLNPSVYLPPIPSERVYLLAIAAHPSEPNQIASEDWVTARPPLKTLPAQALLLDAPPSSDQAPW